MLTAIILIVVIAILLVVQMPYDIIIAAETTQNNGLAGVAGKAPAEYGYVVSGDTIKLPDRENPLLYRFGHSSATKPQGCRLNFTNMGTRVYGPGAIQLWPSGMTHDVLAPVKLFKNETITFNASNTNVNEATWLMAEIAYQQKAAWDMTQFAGQQIFKELFTLTAAAAVTHKSGATVFYSAATNPTDWYSPTAKYYILGIGGSIGADGGILEIYNLPNEWAGHLVGGPINALSGVTFSTEQPEFYFLEPIGPITGNDLKNNVTLAFVAAGTNATTFSLILARDKLLE